MTNPLKDFGINRYCTCSYLPVRVIIPVNNPKFLPANMTSSVLLELRDLDLHVANRPTARMMR